jgi:translation initiation factor IF-2
MTEEQKIKTEESENGTEQAKPGQAVNPPASSEGNRSAQASQTGADQSRPQNRPPAPQGNRPSGPPRPQNAPPGGQSGSPRPPSPRPPQRPGDPAQGAPQQRPGQPTSRQNMDWLRSKPMPSGNRPPAQGRGLDLGRPDAWSGRNKPTGPAGPGAGEQRPPSGPGSTGRPPDGSQPYRGPRPAGTGQPYQGRPTGGYGAPRPTGPGGPRPAGPGGARPGGYGTGRPPFGSRPGVGRPGAPAQTWGKGTESSRRARSARKSTKPKGKPTAEEELDERTRRRNEAEALRGKTAAGAGKLVLGKGKLDLTTDLGKAILVPHQFTVKDLAELLGISSVEIIKELMKNGIMAPINQVIDFETASIVASDLGFEIRQADGAEAEEEQPISAVSEQTGKRLMVVEDDPSKLQPRPPVVTIMGHVDHGKTSLLDAVRRTNVAAGEFGGITQHIGAYQVEEKNQKITFLDTPGHEAFTAMRARGAQVTDIAIVVVAADDGVQPQTLEAINHARAANVPIVVALNKVDKDNANPERVKQQLADAGLVPEDWGGNTVVVPVSAKKGTGVSDLLDMILLVAEMANLKANPDRPAVGTIVEAEMDRSRGPLATVLVQHGTLTVGDYVVVGQINGKIKAMFNDKGKAIRKATPSTPASILGLSDVPQSGDILEVVASERVARERAEQQVERTRGESAVAAPPPLDLGELSKMIAAGAVKELDIVLKVDVQGSLEPIVNSLKKLSDEKEKVEVKLLHQATGQITESDVSLAAAALASETSRAAMVIGFNVEPDASARRTAEIQGVEIRTFKVIYDIIDAIELVVKGLYEPKYGEVADGHAEVRQVFKLTKGVTIAGAIVSDGAITRGAQVRVRRNDNVVFDGRISSLRRFKDDVREVTSGFECGITLEGFNDLLERDVLETYHKERTN